MSAAPARSFTGVAFLLGAATLFAVNGTVSKVVLDTGLSSLRLVEARSALAAAVFLTAALALHPAALRIGPRELAFIAVYGIVGLAMVQWLYFVAIARIPVSIALLVEFTAPLLVALWVRFVRRGPVRSRMWVALGLCLGGLAVVGQVWDGLTLDGLGLLAAAGAAAALATYYLLGEHGLNRHDPVSLAAWSFGATAAFWSLLLPWWTFPFASLTRPAAIAGTHLPVGVLVAWVGVLGTVAPFGLVLLGLRRIGAARAGLIGTAEPVLAGLVAWFALGEALTPGQILGAGIVLAGILFAETSRPPHPHQMDTR
ncbi:MAG: EamA family transporter [Kineosporiaceae bacterium]